MKRTKMEKRPSPVGGEGGREQRKVGGREREIYNDRDGKKSVGERDKSGSNRGKKRHRRSKVR